MKKRKTEERRSYNDRRVGNHTKKRYVYVDISFIWNLDTSPELKVVMFFSDKKVASAVVN